MRMHQMFNMAAQRNPRRLYWEKICLWNLYFLYLFG